MKYFIPEWDDRVDPNYDFIRDKHSTQHNENPLKNDVYMWDIFGIDKVPFDGVLVSRMKLMDNKTRYHKILNEGIHEFLRLPKSFEIMGDCGAWGYIDDQEPPFKTSEVLDYYVRCGFNYGVSIDHLIVPEYKEQREKRWKITLENAREMFELWQSKDVYLNSIRIIGVAQGWDVPSYCKAVRELLEIGYDYIGLGGLARAPTGLKSRTDEGKSVLNIVRGVWSEVSEWIKKTNKKVDIHVFGVARPKILPMLKDFGVTSFDSASFLRRAWLGAGTNYYTSNGKGYAALRVRFQKEDSSLKLLEQETLNKIRSYASGSTSIEEVINSLEEYEKRMLAEEIGKIVEQFSPPEVVKEKVEWILKGNKLSNEQIDEFVKKLRLGLDNANKIKGLLKKVITGITRIEDLRKHYTETLRDRPWAKCDCPICKSVGIEVVIFRGNNRNRRRGFHNTYVFYKVLKNPELWSRFINKNENERGAELLDLDKNQKVLVITGCTKEKLGYDASVKAPAKQMYQGRLFKTVRKYCESMGFDYVIISAKYGLIHPDETIEGYEKVLRTKDDVKRIQPLVEEKLRPLLNNYDKIVVIAGKQYREVLENLWNEKFVAIKGKGYGDLCSIVSKAIPKGKTLLDFTQ